MSQSEQKSLKIAILGCGLMGTALLQGWLRHEEPKHTFSAYVRTEASLERLKRDLDSYNTGDRVSYWAGDALIQTVSEADVVVLGFLPKDLKQVVGSAGVSEAIQDKLIISLLAGVSLADVRTAIVSGDTSATTKVLRISRVIPTLAAKIGESVTLIAENAMSSPDLESVSLVHALFSLVGSSISVPQALMNEATAIGATVNALAIVAIDSITDASVAEGVPRATALALVAQSLRSVCGLMLQGNMTPESVKQSMSTPGGITLNAVVNLDAGSRPGIAAATRSAIQYTRRMND